jgi:formylglycine-generating enzyme required for sulfatase activity
MVRQDEAKRRKEEEARYKGGGRIKVIAGGRKTPRELWIKPGSGEVFRDIEEAWCPTLVVVPAGHYRMGSTDADIKALTEEWGDYFNGQAPQHVVTIPTAFAVGKYAVSFAEWDFAQSDNIWQEITGLAPRRPADEGWGRDGRPVINVNWHDAKAYVTWLSGKTGRQYQLLSEAEWEYACRAETTTMYSWGDSIEPTQANYDCTYTFRGGPEGNPCHMTLSVDSFEPNRWGLVQMHGNVWEWCEDFWYENYENKSEALKASGGARLKEGDPIMRDGWVRGSHPSFRVSRGGCWQNYPPLLGSAVRNGGDAAVGEFDNGFRVARTITPE